MDGTVELYGRGSIDDITIDRCEQRRLRHDGRARDAVARLLGSPDLPRPALFSVAIDPDGGVEALTWFGFAERLFPDHDESIAALERVVPRRHRSVQLLRALADGADDGRWRVGLIGVRLDAAGSTSVQAAIRPS